MSGPRQLRTTYRDDAEVDLLVQLQLLLLDHLRHREEELRVLAALDESGVFGELNDDSLVRTTRIRINKKNSCESESCDRTVQSLTCRRCSVDSSKESWRISTKVARSSLVSRLVAMLKRTCEDQTETLPHEK